jgi:ElaB/YqjD/DUF883 family membrane-anchored ribosome-binding protein
MLELLFNLGVIVSLLRRIERKLDRHMATVKEAFAELATEANKIFDEVKKTNDTAMAKVAQLEAALANRDMTPEEQSAMEEAKAALQKTDDLIPDELPTEPPADTEPETEGN